MDFIESAESMLNVTDQIAENLKRVRERITAACTRSGRSSNEITLVAVTKYAELEWVRSLVELGVHDLGESRPQQLVSRSRLLPAEIRWHQIGHVQRNKVEMLLPIVTLFHSIDSVRLVESLSAAANKFKTQPRILVEVNLSGEVSKTGFSRDNLIAVWPSIVKNPAMKITGLMTMGPLSDDIEMARPVFRQLRELRDNLELVREVFPPTVSSSSPQLGGGTIPVSNMVNSSSLLPDPLHQGKGECVSMPCKVDECAPLSNSNRHSIMPLSELSMGMSADFEIGIEEGATIIRVGSCLFNGLSKRIDER